jgi:NAD-dependent SIR2 family protein deacetylase
MKPDIVFFGEGLPEIFHESMAKDKDECDLLIVIGSSLKVRPVALIPSKCTLFMMWFYKCPPPYPWNASRYNFFLRKPFMRWEDPFSV